MYSQTLGVLNNNEEVSCDKSVLGCGWTGKLGECIRSYYKSDRRSRMVLCGREGYIYRCPGCKKIIKTKCLAIS